MSTRGAYGFKVNKEYKILYNHFDSYPSALGRDIVDFVSRVKEHLPELKAKAEKMKAIKKEVKDHKNIQEILKQSLWEDPVSVLDSVLLGMVSFYPCAEKFLEDNLFCEYAYILNLDDNNLEIFARGDLLIHKFPLKEVPKDWEKKVENSLKNPVYIEASTQALTESLVNKHGVSKELVNKLINSKPAKKRKKSI